MVVLFRARLLELSRNTVNQNGAPCCYNCLKTKGLHVSRGALRACILWGWQSRQPPTTEKMAFLSTHLKLRDCDRIDVGERSGDERNVSQLREELDGARGRGGAIAQCAVVAGDRHVCEGRQGLQSRLNLRLTNEEQPGRREKRKKKTNAYSTRAAVVVFVNNKVRATRRETTK